SFGWMIPIFGEFVSIGERDPQDFADLFDWTQPNVERNYASVEESGGCAGRAKSGDNALRADTGYANDGVEIVAEGYTDSYTYQIIETDSSDAFLAWLDEHDWSTGGAEAAIEAYVEEGGVQFAAITLSDAAGTEWLPPLSLTYAGEAMRFPATMARQSMAESIHTVVYVRGESTAEATGEWSSSALSLIEGDIGDDPTALFEEELRALGGPQRGYGVVFSGPDVGGDWLTRLETIAAPATHIADATFDFTGDQDHESVTVRLTEATSTQGAVWLLGPLALLGAVWRRRRQQA
ncbi:MAG: MYXO-CTERM domain-containing protein, partial [Myxococcota bacterium]